MAYLISVSEAKGLVEEHIFHTEKVRVSLLDAQGHYSAEPIFAGLDVPSFNNSAMDGYGICYDDLANFSSFIVSDNIPAGAGVSSVKLKSGEAVRIFTGAPIPKGVDTVIVQEQVIRDGDTIRLDTKHVRRGDHIRLQGSQTKAGEAILSAHTFINHAVIGFLAGFGLHEVNVYSPVKLGLLYTGNELIDIGQPLTEGGVYNSNAYTLQAALKEIQHSCSFIQHVSDTAEATSSAIQRALSQDINILLITGGISVGDYDYVKPALEHLGVDSLFYKIRQKPGKPLYFGKVGKQYIFALPGNPASVFSCYHQYVKPFLLGCVGRADFYANREEAICNTTVDKKTGSQTQFLKAKVTAGQVEVLCGQESYKMNSVAMTNCLLEFPEDTTQLKAGEKVTIWKI